MFYLIAASILTLTTLADLESVTEEWIAPGADITKETLVEFADHGEMFQSISEPYVGCHVTFVEVEGQEKWRAVVVYADRVVLFQEDQEPVATMHNVPLVDCNFSKSGTYVIMYDDGMIETDRNALRINTETGESIYFDSQPDGMLGQSNFFIWDNGAFMFARRYEEYSSIFFIYNSSLQEICRENIHFSGFVLLSESKLLLAHSEGLSCFDRETGLLWKNGGAGVGYPAITDEYFITTSLTGVQIYSTISGLLLNEFAFPEGVDTGNVFLSNDGNSWICEAYSHAALMERWSISKHLFQCNLDASSQMIFEKTPELRSSQLEFAQKGSSSYLVSLVPREGWLDITCVLVDLDFTPLLAIPWPSYDSSTYVGSGKHSMMLSPDGTRLIYSSIDRVTLVEIGEVK